MLFRTQKIATPLEKGLNLVDVVEADEVAGGVLEAAPQVVVAKTDIELTPPVVTSQ